ncbi:PhzF family phenazine biosynthesis protein [Ruminococcus sp.]|jgi:predicted PhzF superfamily epimerase YddE/YHI9|uniref:PhzF family phenazine biosynthesis protein n=1 Tax=Ruminococcus sp. TaxID=41978 RepID=UPI0025CFCEBC|nr:PhzF family phenazine biosynthesis protein [Ruminococcus sp.]
MSLLRSITYTGLQLGIVNLCVTDEGTEYDCISRVFAPRYGLNEDPVTGLTHCMIAPYWCKRLNKSHITAFQASSRTGILYCDCAGDKVIISGKAALFSINDIVGL